MNGGTVANATGSSPQSLTDRESNMFTSNLHRTLTIGYIISGSQMAADLSAYSWIMRGLPLTSQHVNTINHVNHRATEMFNETNSNELVVNTWRAPSDLYEGAGRHSYRVIRGERKAYGLPPYLVIGSVSYDNVHELYRVRVVYDAPGTTDGNAVVIIEHNVHTGRNATLSQSCANVLAVSAMCAADYVLALGGDYAVKSNLHQVTIDEVIEEILQLSNLYVTSNANKYCDDAAYIRGFCRAVLDDTLTDLLARMPRSTYRQA